MKGSHGQLRSRLANGLSRNNTNRFAKIHQLISSQIFAIHAWYLDKSAESVAGADKPAAGKPGADKNQYPGRCCRGDIGNIGAVSGT